MLSIKCAAYFYITCKLNLIEMSSVNHSVFSDNSCPVFHQWKVIKKIFVHNPYILDVHNMEKRRKL